MTETREQMEARHAAEPMTVASEGVTQADRNAAVGILQLSLGNSQERAMMIEAGKLDSDPLVQAFTRHRQSAQSNLIAALRGNHETTLRTHLRMGTFAQFPNAEAAIEAITATLAKHGG